MTATSYLSIPNSRSGGYTLIGPTINPFGSVDGVSQNLDAQIYFSASTYIPTTVTTDDPIPQSIGGQALLTTVDWNISIDLEGRAVFGIPNFYCPQLPTAAQWAYIRQLAANLNVADGGKAYRAAFPLAVRSTVPVPTTQLSPNGLYLRVYVNAYGGSTSYPGASSSPCVVFFTSPDEGATFVQFGDPVPLPSRTDPTEVLSNPAWPVAGADIIQPLPQGNYIPLSYGNTLNVFVCGTVDPCGIQLEVLPEMQVYKYSLQDCSGRYMLDFDFTVDPVLTLPHLYNGAALIAADGSKRVVGAERKFIRRTHPEQ